MQLNELLSGILSCEDLNQDILGVTNDPNQCKPGYLYVADESETVDSLQLGKRLNGNDYIDMAIKNGASVVLTNQKILHLNLDVKIIYFDKPLFLLGHIYKKLFNIQYPKTIALVTGTDGKTSTVNFTKMLWSLLGYSSCSIGNLGAVTNTGEVYWPPDFTLTVPDTISLHSILKSLKEQEIDYVACEATSHALFEYRLSHIPAKIGAFTNLTPDHLNFHHTMENYFKVKMRLFNEVLPIGSFAVLNADSDYFLKVKKICEARKHQIISFGYHGQDIKLLESRNHGLGKELKLLIQGSIFNVQFNVLGEFQTWNLLCSIGMMLASGMDINNVISKIPLLTTIEGRLDTVGFTPSGGRVIVDFAHTINGIKQALVSCRQFTKGKIYIIIGAESHPQKDKCKKIAEIATKYADKVIITDGHVCKHSSKFLRSLYLVDAPDALEIDGRERAIEYGCQALTKDDCLLITGMGHEQFRWEGNDQIPYSDKKCVLEIIEKIKYNSILK